MQAALRGVRQRRAGGGDQADSAREVREEVRGGGLNAHAAAPPPVAAILCDLDGTLLDTVPDIAAAVNAVLRELDDAPIAESTVAGYVGQGVDVLLHRALSGSRDGRVDAERLQRARALFDVAYAAVNGRATRTYAGVVDGLERFRALGVRLACVTNKPQAAAEAALAKFALAAYFELVLGDGVLPRRKPAPEPMWYAADRLGVAAADCLALGDSANDAGAARAAGMPIVLVDYGYTEGHPVAEIDCDAIVSSFVELADALAGAADARFGFLRRERAPQRAG
ncbi:MAG TPA: phosphoglycolate phosphatase [Dokdonella sp.]